MKSNLTAKQERFFKYLREQIRQTGEPPSLREAGKDLGVSHAAVAQMLKALEDKGHVKREGRYSRTIRILDKKHAEARGNEKSRRWRPLPIIGRITAGLPMYAQEEWDGELVVDAGLFRGQNLFVLRVKGDSMKDAGIMDGDHAICEPRQFAENGEIVVALIRNEEATVKRFFLHDNRVELRPENPEFSPTFYHFGEILIQGKVIGIQRGPDTMETL